MNPKMRDLIVSSFLSVFLGLFVSGLLMLFLGANPFSVYGRLFSFLVRDGYTFADIFVKATPLIFTALAFAFTFKANLYNIGAQGQFYIGALTSVAASLLIGPRLPGIFSLVLILIVTALAGGIWGGFVGFVKARFNANDFLVSMMSVYVALALMNYLLRTVLIETKHEYPQTNPIADTLFIPTIIPGTRLHAGFIIAILVAIFCWWFLYKTTIGFRIRVVGLNPVAAGYAGIESGRIYIIAFLISGALAGMAGFTEVNGVQHMLVQDFNTTIGSEGIGIAILANAHPIGIIFGAILFGALKVGGSILGQTSGIPSSIIGIMEGFVMIFVLLSFWVRKKLELRRDIAKLKTGVNR
ncbi:ABC transporter permease [Sediminispirochaeta bajacaliforniensis]|uniref:ABC transporter permease n=1 Tax=Sediminispirochaeta bajacaliforniensis TaxID=148 RepID=UPI000373E239|nr:ABC transporter permease [Sediminispirochaeta bajacaliforniensis]